MDVPSTAPVVMNDCVVLGIKLDQCNPPQHMQQQPTVLIHLPCLLAKYSPRRLGGVNMASTMSPCC